VGEVIDTELYIKKGKFKTKEIKAKREIGT
jgi:hypothetical protein